MQYKNVIIYLKYILNGNTEIEDYGSESKELNFIINKSNDKVAKEITIYCNADSFAQKYAQNHDFKYIVNEN